MSHLLSWIQHESSLIINANALLVLSILILTGIVIGNLAKKFKLPSVTGCIIGGVLLGPYVFNIFTESSYEAFSPITHFVLGLIGLTIGSHLDFRKLHNAGKRITWITFMDVLITAPIVFFALYQFAGLAIEECLLLSAIACATAPGSMLHVVKERKAKGMFTKTILAVVAFNNVVVILLFYTLYYYAVGRLKPGDVSLVQTMLRPFLYLSESFITGGTVGFALIYLTEKRKKILFSFPAMVLFALVLSVGISQTLHFSGLLTSLILGMIITNYSRFRDDFFSAFHDLEEIIFATFFVLAGTHLDFHALKVAGIAGLVLIVARFVGKFIGPTLGSHFADSTITVRKWIGLALYPLAGVAIGLMLIITDTPIFQPHASTLAAIVLSAVIFFEVIGPILTGMTISKSGESQKNRLRLLDFLQEEYIRLNISAKDKWEALESMSEFMYKVHNIKEISLDELKKGVIAREKEITTGIGNNIAIPHVIVEGGPAIRGVIGICKDGIEFNSMDDQPVKIIILIATPKDRYELHLQVLANVAKIFSHHSHIKELIIHARTPEEVYEILQREEVDKLNPFFED